ncbi:MAG: glycosyltransferase family 4 protein [Acidimicrobiia bacterium]
MGGGVRLSPATPEPLVVALDASALGSGRGGDESYVRTLVAGLAATTRPGDRARIYVRRGATAPTDGNPAVVVDEIPQGGPVRLVTSLPARARRRRDELFVGYTHLPLPSPRRAALVITDLSFRHHPEHYPRLARARLSVLVPRQAARSETVITLSEFCRYDLIDGLGLDPDRVRVVPCAAEVPVALTPDEDERTRQWARSRGIRGPFILYLGNLHPRKNVARLIRAHAGSSTHGLQLVIAGGSWWAGGGERAAAEDSPPGRVVMTGRVDDVQRSWLLRTAEALAYPSVFEGFGLPPLEAMAVGTPVLAADATAIPEVCGDAALLVDPYDVEALACGLERVVGDASLRSTLRARGIERVEHYSVRRAGEALYAALSDGVARA